MNTVEAATIRVERGARWLDENFPGWESRINARTLSLANGSRCICGQVFKKEAKEFESYDIGNGYSYAWHTLFTDANSWITAIVKLRTNSEGRRLSKKERERRSARVGIALGFMEGCLDLRSAHECDQLFVGFDRLQKVWKALLKSRENALVNV